MNAAPPLLGLLGASWNMGAPVVATAWDAESGAIGFALGDGHLAVANAKWTGGPRVELKPGGGVSVIEATEPAPQPVRAVCHQGSCLSLAADAGGGFLTGGDDGRVVHVPRVGAPAVLGHVPGTWVTALASCGRTGTRAFASGKQVCRLVEGVSEYMALPAPATAIAFSPDGEWLAITHSGGATLWSTSGASRLLPWSGYHRTLAWSPNSRYLASGMQENALHAWRVADGGDIEMGGYPGQPLSLSFAHHGRYLATSGGTRPVCWPFDPPNGDDSPVECSIASKTPVTCVACHPQQSLIAAGYFNGAVLLCSPGSSEGLFIKGSGGGAVNALTWSGNGSRLALGTQDGLLGWLNLPEGLFRSRSTDRPIKESIQ